jgi:hypothetical protein
MKENQEDKINELATNRITRTSETCSVSCDQNACQNWDIRIGNRLFKTVAQFKYLGMTVTNQNLIQEEIRKCLNCGSVCLPFSPEPTALSSAVKKC